MASMENDKNYKIDYELLALFDDASALSHMESCRLDSSYLEYNFSNEPRSSVATDDRREKKKEDREIYMENERDEKNVVFAVPKVYACMYCLKRFYSRSASRKHQVCHAKKQLRCPYCRTRSYSMNVLRRHFEYFHPSACRRQQILIETQ